MKKHIYTQPVLVGITEQRRKSRIAKSKLKMKQIQSEVRISHLAKQPKTIISLSAKEVGICPSWLGYFQ